MAPDIERRSEEILGQILKNPHLKKYVDQTLNIPRAFKGTGDIRLVVLGQDPTVKNPAARKSIDCVLNLDRDGNLRAYLVRICGELEIDLEKNVYATNCLKNFFIEPPTELSERKIEVIEDSLAYWLPLLKEELAMYPHVPVIVFGDPILKHLLLHGKDHSIRDYWDYSPEWKDSPERRFRFIRPDDNHLRRQLFPFPHEPSHKAEFYQANLSAYIKFMLDSGI